MNNRGSNMEGGESTAGSNCNANRACGTTVRQELRLLALRLCAWGCVLVCFPAAAQYAIDWHTMDGGGGASTGGVYSVSGTIGQPDAGGAMTNGSFALVGGFWAAPVAVQTPGAPQLTMERLANGLVRIYWPRPAENFRLESTSTFAMPETNTFWNLIPFPYQTNATHIWILDSTSGSQFFRLRKQ